MVDAGVIFEDLHEESVSVLWRHEHGVCRRFFPDGAGEESTIFRTRISFTFYFILK